IRMLWTVAVKSLDDRLGLQRHLVNGSIAEVHYAVWMTERPGCIRRAPAVSRVGGRSCVPRLHRDRQRGITDRTCEATVALTRVLAVPCRSREPHFGFDVRVFAGLDVERDPTESGQLFEDGCVRHRAGQLKLSGSHQLR